MVHRLLIVVASLVERWLYGVQVSVIVMHRLGCSEAREISQTRD